MNIQEMHSAFRTLGQQMGLQLVRGILPESIDVYLNDVIMEKARTELLQGVRTVLQEEVATQASTMSPINTFRHLYRTARYAIDTAQVGNTNKVSFYNTDNGYTVINIPTINSSITISGSEFKINPMMFLGFSVEYENTLRGNPVACRLVGSDVLETTLRDFCNGASKDSPVCCLSAIPIVSDNTEQSEDISNEQVEFYLNSKGASIKFINVKYIKNPNVVKYDIDLAKCINCDLPIFTHFEVVERAVYKFYQSIGATAGNNNQKQQ